LSALRSVPLVCVESVNAVRSSNASS